MERMLQRSGDTLAADLSLGGFALTNGSLATSVAVPNTSVFPVGMITLWSGAIGSIPAGWALCNGANGTPDLRDRFVVGAGSGYAVGATGGAASVTPTASADGAHTHSGVTGSTALSQAQLPAHNHSVLCSPSSGSDIDPITLFGAGLAANNDNGTTVQTANGSGTMIIAGGGNGDGHTHTIGSDGSHTHTLSAVDTRSPYYALAYIMFTG
jgi:microcystin-dependent protein